MTCAHPAVNILWCVHTLAHPSGDGSVMRVFSARAHCQKCGAGFQFLGNNAPGPMEPAEALQKGIGAWTSPIRHELACMIAPFDESPLATMQPAGRA